VKSVPPKTINTQISDAYNFASLYTLELVCYSSRRDREGLLSEGGGFGAGHNWAEAGAKVETGDVTQLGTYTRNESRDLGSNHQPREELAR